MPLRLDSLEVRDACPLHPQGALPCLGESDVPQVAPIMRAFDEAPPVKFASNLCHSSAADLVARFGPTQ